MATFACSQFRKNLATVSTTCEQGRPHYCRNCYYRLKTTFNDLHVGSSSAGLHRKKQIPLQSVSVRLFRKFTETSLIVWYNGTICVTTHQSRCAQTFWLMGHRLLKAPRHLAH